MQEFQNSTVRLHEDLPYQEWGDRKLDVYQPPSTFAPPHKVIFYIHGGALHFGHKGNSRNVCTHLAMEGYLTIAPSYSLSNLSDQQLQSILTLVAIIMLGLAATSGSSMQLLFMLVLTAIIMLTLITLWTFVPREEITHPAHIADIAAAYRWVHDHVGDYQGNRDWMAVAGHSAGAHLAALLATNESYLQAQGLTLESVKACIGISGIYSDKRLQDVYLGRQILRNAFGDRPNYYDAFPIYNVSEKTPPFLLINAASDISLKQHSLDLHYTLLEYGAFSEIVYVDQTNHFSIMKDMGPGERHESTLKKICSFLEEVAEVPP